MGVLRITSTYAAASCETTGMRWARAAPRTAPTTKEPAIAIADSSSVCPSPCASSPALSVTNDHSKVTASISQKRGAAACRPLPGSLLRAHRLGRALRIAEADLRPQDVLRESRQEPPRDVVLQDPVEEVALAHEVQARVDPALHRDVPLLDADPVREREKRVVRELEVAVGGRDPEQHGVVPHQR